MRAFAKAQQIIFKLRTNIATQQFREGVRQHFKAAVAQEKGRVAYFQLSASRSVSEHSDPLPSEIKHVLHGTEVVDLRTLPLSR